MCPALQSHVMLLEGDLHFLHNTCAHVAQVEEHVGRFAEEMRASLAAKSRLHVVRSPYLYTL